MEKKMNKTEFIRSLQEKTTLSKDSCILINDIFENHFLLGKKNKNKILKDFQEYLNVDVKEAEEIYTISMSLLKNSLKEKLRHPFG